MKAEFYIDVYRGQTSGFNAFPGPAYSPVMEGYKRVIFSVDIPMEKLFPADLDLGIVTGEAQ